MHFMVYTLRDLDHPALDAELEQQHIAWVTNIPESVAVGAFMNDAGTGIVGGFVVLDAETPDRAESIANEDPFVRAGIYSTHAIHATLWSPAQG